MGGKTKVTQSAFPSALAVDREGVFRWIGR
jgi:hypothetical protein